MILQLFLRAVLRLGLIGFPLCLAQSPLQVELDTTKKVVLRWSNVGPLVIESTAQLGPTVVWKPVTQAVDLVTRTLVLQPAESTQFYRLREATPLIRVISTSPEAEEFGISVLREVILRFSEPLPSSVSINNSRFFVEADGRKLLGRVEMAGDRRSATLFHLEPIPGSSRVRVELNGVNVGLPEGNRINFDGDFVPGGIFTMAYRTHDTSATFGTAISGRVFAAERISDGNGNVSDHPLANVTITVDGAEERLRAVTDVDGFFRLSPCPAGKFFVHIDGRTSGESQWPNGAYYPVIGKTWSAVAGLADNLANGTGEIFLPKIPADALKATELNIPTVVSLPPSVIAANPAMAGVQIIVPPGALYSNSGLRGGKIGLALVPADRLPEPLPSGLNFPIVITVQTDGPQNFSEPVPVRFPNLPDPITGTKLGPGGQTALWSFNHDSGKWEVQGPATVTADAQYIESDPGFGIRQPGWHGTAPGVPATLPRPRTCDDWEYPDILQALAQNAQAVAGTAAAALADQILCIASKAAQNSGTWGDGFVKEVLRGIACNAQNSHLQNVTQYPCSLIPANVPVPVGPFWTGDLCFAIEGFGYHTIFELLPGFEEQICNIDDGQHNSFIYDGIIPCLGSNPNLGTTMASVAQTTVPPILIGIREAMQAVSICDGFSSSRTARPAGFPPLPPAPTEADLRVPAFDQSATLQVDTGGKFFLPVGTSLQLRVLKNGQDITLDPATKYTALLGAGLAGVTSQGLVTAHSTSNSLPVATPTFYVQVNHGNNEAIAQFALTDVDSDGDWMVDSYERSVGLDPNAHNDRGMDTDQDGYSDFAESVRRTSPTRTDSDGDGISDPEEIGMGWNPISAGSPSDAERVAQGPYYSLIEDLEFGVDFRAYAANGLEGVPTQVLAPNRKYRRWIYSPLDGRRGSVEFTSTGLGTSMVLPQPVMRLGTSPDSDSDGLDNEAERIVGTDSTKPDTDGDVVSDFDEVRQGRDPLTQQSRPLGLISTLALPGRTRGLTRQENLVYVTVETDGVIIADVRNPDQPTIAGQINLTGSSFSVAISQHHGVAAVAAFPETGLGTDYGLHFVDITNPATPRWIRTLPFPVSAVAEHRGRFFAAVRKEIRILDAGTGAELGWFPTRTDGFGLTVAGDRLYIATAEGLEIHDISIPLPQLLGWTATTDALVSRFFEGDMVISQGILHAATGRGFLTVNLSNPQQPIQLARSKQVPSLILHGLALNGSGRMASLVSFSAGPRDLSLFDATNPLELDRFLTSFRSQGQAHDLEFMSGIILVADDRVGLSIFNSTGPDSRGVAPRITVDFSKLDLDLNRPGIQVMAGTVLPVDVGIVDDVQMQEASLWVDGQKRGTRDSGPVLFTLEVPAVVPASGSISVHIQAEDTGGATSQSLTVLLEILPDIQGPTLLSSYPQAGGATTVSNVFVFRFNEVLSSGARDPLGIVLMDLGPDGVLGGSDDRRVPISSVTSVRESLYVTPSEVLGASTYSITIPALLVKDRAGNPIAEDISLQFRALPITVETMVWIAPGGGQFSDPGNWLQNRVPNSDPVYIPAIAGSLPVSLATEDTVLRRLEHLSPFRLEPRSELTVLEDWISRGPVVVSNALAVVESSGRFEAPWEISGGTLLGKGPMTFNAGVSVVRGGEFILDGTRASFAPAAAFSGSAFKFRVRNGATSQLPQFTDYTDAGNFAQFLRISSVFSASGSNSRLTLPALTQARGPVDWVVFSVPSLTFDATSGGILDLPQLGAVRDRIRIHVTGVKSAVLAPVLATIDGPVSDFPSTIDVFDSGELRLGATAIVERCQVRLDSRGVLRCNDLEITSSASLAGSGTIAGSLRNPGKLRLNSLPNTLIVEGNFELQASSVVETTIALWNGKVEAGRIEVRGSTTLGGILKLIIPKISSLKAGDEYEIAEFASPAVGTFASLDDSGLGNALKAELVSLPTGLKVRILAR